MKKEINFLLFELICLVKTFRGSGEILSTGRVGQNSYIISQGKSSDEGLLSNFARLYGLQNFLKINLTRL